MPERVSNILPSRTWVAFSVFVAGLNICSPRLQLCAVVCKLKQSNVCVKHSFAHNVRFFHTMAKTEAISIRVEPVLKEAIAKLADADRRKVAAYVELVLIEHCINKGSLKPGAAE